MAPLPDSRSPLAVASEWATRTMTVSLEMVLPGLAGLWIDKKIGTGFIFALLGFALGMFVAMKHLLRMTSSSPTNENSKQQLHDQQGKDP